MDIETIYHLHKKSYLNIIARLVAKAAVDSIGAAPTAFSYQD